MEMKKEGDDRTLDDSPAVHLQLPLPSMFHDSLKLPFVALSCLVPS